NQMRNPCPHISISYPIIMISIRLRCTLDLLWVTSNLLTPTIKHFHLMSNSCRITKTMPHISIFGSDTQRLLLATTANQNGYGTINWAGSVLLPTLLDDGDTGL